MDKKRVLASFFVLSLVLLGLSYAFVVPVSASGGGLVQNGSMNNNAGSTTCAATLPNFATNDFWAIWVWVAKGQTVSSVSDGTNNGVQQASSAVNVDIEVWTAQWTGAAGSVTVTATLSASAVNKCIVKELTDLTSATKDSSSSGSGAPNATPMPTAVGSFTPATTDYCEEGVAATSTGTVSATSQTPSAPFITETAGGVGTAGNGKQLWTSNRPSWPGGATTGVNSIVETGMTTDAYDELVVCWATTPVTTTASTTTTTTTVTTASVTASTTTSSTTSTTTLVNCSNCGEAPNYSWLLVFPFILIILVLVAKKKR